MRAHLRIATRSGAHTLLAIFSTMLAMPICVAAQAPVPAPMTREALRTLFVDAWSTSARIDSVGTRIYGASVRGKALAADFAKHNAEPCEYPQGQPELCANFDRERMDLNLRLADLQKEWGGYDSEQKVLRAHFATLMTRLREAPYPGDLATWKDAMVTCSNINGVAEASACLTKAANRRR